MNDNALYAYRYLQDKYKLKDYQAAGIVGNLIQESSMNTGARNAGDGTDGTDSIGVGQWNGQRARNFKSFAGDNTGNLDTQLDFVMHELQGSGGNGGGSEAYAWNKLANAGNVNDATAAMISYERPHGWSKDDPTAGHGWNNRITNASELLGVDPTSVAQAQAKSSPTSDNPLFAMIQGKAPDAPKPAEDPKSQNGILIQAYNKLTGSDVQVPSTIPDSVPILGGADTSKVMKGISGIGDFAKSMAENDQSINNQIQRAAAGARGGRNSEPVTLTFIDYASDRKKKKGGLGNLGGYLLG
ncbi:phage tail tip lysozyme [Neorhizobium sp. NCHU2750]|uniref:phage tail tip lysozyme n=1 Tax=Neorhizobium sp. NCHU2750 TaxID=1825976 RepID=UPI000E74280E|nr:hypothetical protein NCHU2750_15220 [Neorhizobium sp. NCHU2750]